MKFALKLKIMTEEKEKSGSRLVFKKLECPFDLETVFTLQYSTEGLKGVLEWIIENLGNLNTTVGDLDKRLAAKIAQIDK